MPFPPQPCGTKIDPLFPPILFSLFPLCASAFMRLWSSQAPTDGWSCPGSLSCVDARTQAHTHRYICTHTQCPQTLLPCESDPTGRKRAEAQLKLMGNSQVGRRKRHARITTTIFQKKWTKMLLRKGARVKLNCRLREPLSSLFPSLFYLSHVKPRLPPFTCQCIYNSELSAPGCVWGETISSLC